MNALTPIRPKQPKLREAMLSPIGMQAAEVGGVSLVNMDSLLACSQWAQPDCIISDGPYGLGLFPGEAETPFGLGEWYSEHAKAWFAHSKPSTTLWFWNSELGWANSHAALEAAGWEYQEAVVWDKGIAHIAGNVNSKTIRGTPVVTEISVRYTKKLFLNSGFGQKLSVKDWVRAEWMRSGLPMHQANQACGVANAATRKYLTKDHLWYFPPGLAIVAMHEWCAKYGAPTGIPYFSLDGHSAPNADVWDRLRAPWVHVHGRTNVWSVPPVHGAERVKKLSGTGYLHANQKPLELMKRQISSCTFDGDVIWEPFGGLCSASVAASALGRRAFSAEVNPLFFEAAMRRLRGLTNL